MPSFGIENPGVRCTMMSRPVGGTTRANAAWAAAMLGFGWAHARGASSPYASSQCMVQSGFTAAPRRLRSG